MSGDHQESVLFERIGRVGHIRLNRPKSLNALDAELGRALLARFEEAGTDPGIRVIVLSGAGRSFMAGGDLAVFAADLSRAPETAAALIDLFHATMRRIADGDQLVIAAVQGPVAGGGFSLALGCDLCIAAADTTFISAYAQIGANPDGGGSWSATRLLGARRALAFLLSTGRIDAARALELGMVNEVVETGDVLARALALAAEIAAGAQGSIRAARHLVRSAMTGSFAAQLELEKRAFVANAARSDFHEGITAFLARRPARFD